MKTNPGCKVCGAIYRRHDKAYKDRAKKLGVAPGTTVERECPNIANHDRLLRTKSALAKNAKTAFEEELISSTEDLAEKIQRARTKLHAKWQENNGFVLIANTGELKEKF